jgi:hypothetical protein
MFLGTGFFQFFIIILQNIECCSLLFLSYFYFLQQVTELFIFGLNRALPFISPLKLLLVDIVLLINSFIVAYYILCFISQLLDLSHQSFVRKSLLKQLYKLLFVIELQSL